MHTFYMNIAIAASRLSSAKRNKVGAVLVKDTNIVSFGYNGTPSGCDNTCEDLNNSTLPTVIHSELNAISKAAKQGVSTNGTTLYCTLSPCYECSKAIIQAGISEVIYLDEYRIPDSIEFLKTCNIKVSKFENIV